MGQIFMATDWLDPALRVEEINHARDLRLQDARSRLACKRPALNDSAVGGMPLGHPFAGFLTYYMSPPWVPQKDYLADMCL